MQEETIIIIMIMVITDDWTLNRLHNAKLIISVMIIKMAIPT